MSYRVQVKRSASKALDTIPAYDRQRILEALSVLQMSPRPGDCKKLVGREGWRILSQNPRVIYDSNDGAKQIVVQVIGHRRDLYQ